MPMRSRRRPAAPLRAQKMSNFVLGRSWGAQGVSPHVSPVDWDAVHGGLEPEGVVWGRPTKTPIRPPIPPTELVRVRLIFAIPNPGADRNRDTCLAPKVEAQIALKGRCRAPIRAPDTPGATSHVGGYPVPQQTMEVSGRPVHSHAVLSAEEL